MSSRRVASSCVVAAAMVSCTSTSAFVVPSAPARSLLARASLSRSTPASRTRQRPVVNTVCMDATLQYLDDPMLVPLTEDDYVAFGLACCFVMNDDLKPDEYHVYEPLTAGTLETIAGSAALETSYRRVTAFRAGDIFEGSPAKPTGIQVDKLKILLDGEVGHPCENILERTLAAARTFRRRVEAQVCGFGDVMSDFNFSTKRKRILNQKYEPSFDDNVKQDKSIDVYGRDDQDVAKQVADLENL